MSVLESKESHEIKDLKIVIHEAVQAQNEFLRMQEEYGRITKNASIIMAIATAIIAILTGVIAFSGKESSHQEQVPTLPEVRQNLK